MFFDPEKHGSKNMNSGNDLSRNRSSSEIAGIDPYDCMPVDKYFLTYGLLFTIHVSRFSKPVTRATRQPENRAF
jgi:hypothetical protein